PGLQGPRGSGSRDPRLRQPRRGGGDHRGRARPRRTVTVVFGAIAPHGDPAFVEGSSTRLAFEELGRRLEQAEPDATVVFTPHNVHVEGAFAVATAATMAGSLDEISVELGVQVERELAAGVVASLRDAGLPAVGVSYGSNDEALAVMPLDWGT